MDEQQNCAHDCATCGSDCDERFENEKDSDALHELSIINKSILIASAKGGTGKSVVTALLACELTKKKYRVGILDGDLSGASISLLFDVAEAPEIIHGGMHPVQTKNGISLMSFPLLMPTPSAPLYWSGAKCAAFAKQFWTDVIWDNLDFLLIDTPSDTDEVTQMFFNLNGPDGTLIVTEPGDVSNIVTARTINYARMCGLKILGAVENFSDREESGRDSVGPILSEFSIPLLDTIAYDKSIATAAANGELHQLNTDLFGQTIRMLETL